MPAIASGELQLAEISRAAWLPKEGLGRNFLWLSQDSHIIHRVIHRCEMFLLEPARSLVDDAVNANVRRLIDRKCVRFANSRKMQTQEAASQLNLRGPYGAEVLLP